MLFLERDLRPGASAPVASALQVHQVLPIGGLASQLQRFAAGGAHEARSCPRCCYWNEICAARGGAGGEHAAGAPGAADRRADQPAAAVRRRRRARGPGHGRGQDLRPGTAAPAANCIRRCPALRSLSTSGGQGCPLDGISTPRAAPLSSARGYRPLGLGSAGGGSSPALPA